jgi:hypothetical protein
MLRGAVLALLVLASAAGCGDGAGGEGAPEVEPDCVARLLWHGVTYWSAGSPEEPLALGRRLGKGTVPGCDEDDAGREVTVVEVRGTSPSVAVALEGEGDPPYAWLAAGYLSESTRHPLHDALYGGPARPDAEAGFRCESPRVLRARALTTPTFDGFLQVEAEDEELEQFLRAGDADGVVAVDAATVVIGHERDGIPFVQAGDEFWLAVRACTGTDRAGPGMRGLRRLVIERLGP